MFGQINAFHDEITLATLPGSNQFHRLRNVSLLGWGGGVMEVEILPTTFPVCGHV